MKTKRITMRVLGTAALFAGFGLNAAVALPPAPKPEEMAAVQPKQEGVEVSKLTPTDLARSHVEPFPDAKTPVGYVLLDANNRPVRRFVAVNSPNFNILSFYLDGEEVYRETDSKGAGRVDQFRWLGSNGSKIGRDATGKGTVDVWDSITPEEVSKELFDAIVNKDINKLKALLPSDAELKALGLPEAELAKIKARIANVGQRFNATVQACALTAKAKWIHVEFFLPQTTPADAIGSAADIVVHRNGGVLFDKGDGKNADFFQTGELIKIGNAWRIIDGPAPGTPEPLAKGGQNVRPDVVPQAVQPLVAQLLAIPDPGPAAPPAAQIKFHADRAVILEKIVGALQGNPAQESWMRQLIEAYAQPAELGDKPAYERLGAWVAQINKAAAKTPLAGFATFRGLSVDYVVKLKEASTPPNAVKMSDTQKWWRDSLEKFVNEYPTIEETPEALYRLAMAHEFNGRSGEASAISFYMALAKNFPQHPLAAQSSGAATRLGSEGKPFTFTACTDMKTGAAFNPATLAGKVVIVYFWGSFAAQNGQLKADAAYLADLAKKYAGKLEIVTVTLDANPAAAVASINASQLPGTHLISPNGAMVTAWGVMGQHIFLLDKAGKVDDKNASIPQVGDQVDKLAK